VLVDCFSEGSRGAASHHIVSNDFPLVSWALGVIHFTLIGGYPPFYTESNQKTFQRILKADVKFDDLYWGHVSQDCKDLILG